MVGERERRREKGDGEGSRVCAREREAEKEGERRGKGKETERARRRQALIELVIFKAFFLSIVCRGTGIREGGRKKKFTPISKSLTSFLTDVVSALLFN